METEDPKLSLEEQENAVIAKYLQGHNLSLEETALAIWMSEGRKTKKPFSKMYARKIEQSALAKLRKGLKKLGIEQYDDVFDVAKDRRAAGFGRGCGLC